MRKNLPVTNVEYRLSHDQALVSTTDDKGRILTCNQAFIEASGFTEDELIGQPHNLIRHPDMPEEAFRDLWDTIQKGRLWRAYVKNRRKNGDHYWVSANVTPLRHGERIVGYLSVRSVPSREEVAAAEQLYATMRAEHEAGRLLHKISEGQVWRDTLLGRARRLLTLGMEGRLGVLATVAVAVLLGAGAASERLGLPAWALLVELPILSGLIAMALRAVIARPVRNIERFARDLAACDLTKPFDDSAAGMMRELGMALSQVSQNSRAVMLDTRNEIEAARQTRQALVEADRILFMVDARDGLTPHDQDIAQELRRFGERVILVVNKAEGMPSAAVAAEFHPLGLGEPVVISSAHGDGVPGMIEYALAQYVEATDTEDHNPGEAAEGAVDGLAAIESVDAPADDPNQDEVPRGPVKIAVVGRPNAGKSTLINALLGEERLVAFDLPGTTRDSVTVPFEHRGRAYELIDTAGVRRRSRVSEAIEKFSVIKALQAIEAAHVCVLLIDATEGIAEQDTRLAGYVLEAGRALVVAVNKWDALDGGERDWLKQTLERKFHFLSFARFLFVSALHGQGLSAIMRAADEAWHAAIKPLSTPKLTRALQAAVAKQQPPRKGMVRPKLRYAHQGGRNPPVIVIHGSALDHVPDAYRRYLEGVFRREFGLEGTPLRIELRTGRNPYAKSG
ncbi:MAG: ribosome biogenesis GTPase Der [Burkholderiaceae bacterium]